MRRLFLTAALSGLLASCGQVAQSSEEPIMAEQSEAQGFEQLLRDYAQTLDAHRKNSLAVPTPKDAGGGYTHELHKQNAKTIYEAGQLYALTGETRFAEYAADLMLAYAEVYPDWDLHPAKKEQSPGRMFWQNLNESWWLLHVAQGYGAIKETLSQTDRDKIETNLLREMAEFLSDGSPETFDKIHNHGTWATAAVGLTGYAIDDPDYVEQALMGLDKSGDAGFLKQLDRLFSPDGYYNEGPYYQRYALMPFVVFAQAVETREPDREIFNYRDGILEKAIYATIQQSYAGLFFPINDAIKDKDIATTELKYGVAIAYARTGDPGLLSIAAKQGRVVPTIEGRNLAQAMASGLTEPFEFSTMRFGDGADGTEGALDILRVSSDTDDTVVVVKNTSQGLGHGHFDKLGLLVFDAGNEILRDYGAARFLNVEAKYGGHYLRENNSFAKQTIAHNALVVDEVSHFSGQTKVGNRHAPYTGVFSVSDALKITSATIETAYDGVNLDRTVALVDDPAFAKPVIIDVMEAHSNASHQYDLPFYYNGQLIETSFDVTADTTVRRPLGQKNGYQYLWKVGSGNANGLSQVTFLNDRRFYSVSTAVPTDTNVIFAEIGANDPDTNLRREPAFILRNMSSDGVSFISVIEPHGEYNPTVEFTVNSRTSIASIQQVEQGRNDLILITTKAGQTVGLGLAGDQTEGLTHSVTAGGRDYQWIGPYHLFPSESER